MNRYIKRFKNAHPDYWKLYYQQNKDYWKHWYQQNKEKLMERQKEYYQLHRKEKIEYSKKYNKRYIKNNPWRKNLKNIRQRCHYEFDKKYKYYGGKGINCLLTLDQIKHLWFRDKAYLMKQPSVDRMDGQGHYELNNCKFIEMDANRKKKNKHLT